MFTRIQIQTSLYSIVFIYMHLINKFLWPEIAKKLQNTRLNLTGVLPFKNKCLSL